MSVSVLQGDCMDLIEQLEDESFDCILTDPPYGETSLAWDVWPAGWPAAVRRLLKKTGSMWVFGSQRMFWDHRGEFDGYQLAQDVVWEKHNGSSLRADRFRRVHEIAMHFYRDDAAWADVYKQPQFTNDARARVVRKRAKPAQWHGSHGASVYVSEDGGPKLMRSVIYARSMHGIGEHPTQKPLSIVEPLLLYSCPPGGRVLDLFAGSGTTGLLAARHGMDAILIEGREDYAAVIRDRLANDAPLLQVAS